MTGFLLLIAMDNLSYVKEQKGYFHIFLMESSHFVIAIVSIVFSLSLSESKYIKTTFLASFCLHQNCLRLLKKIVWTGCLTFVLLVSLFYLLFIRLRSDVEVMMHVYIGRVHSGNEYFDSSSL